MSQQITSLQDLDNVDLIPAIQRVQLTFTTAKQFLHTRQDLLKRLGKLGSNLTIGIEEPGNPLTFRYGQFAVLHGRASNNISSLLCVKAILPKPLGTNSNVIFIDGGNVFNPYLISEHSVRHELNPKDVLERVHISRAFTYHQLTTLIEKLPSVLDKYGARLVIVANMTLLYCDPDIRGTEKQDALQTFLKTVKLLKTLAERKRVLILATNLQSNHVMDKLLLHVAHISMRFEDRFTFTELRILKHPWIPQLKILVPKPSIQTLEAYL